MTVVAVYAGNDEAAKEFTDRTGIETRKWDVGDHQACIDGCAEITESVGPIDVLVNNAGITRDGTMQRMTFDDWNEVMRVNLGGCFNMAKAIYPGMRERGWGRIGHPWFHQGAGAGRCAHGRYRERHRTGLYRYRYGRRRAGGSAGKDRSENSGRPSWPSRRDRPRRAFSML